MVKYTRKLITKNREPFTDYKKDKFGIIFTLMYCVAGRWMMVNNGNAGESVIFQRKKIVA